MNILYIVSGINSVGGIESFCRAVVPLMDFNEFHIDFLITQDEPIGDIDSLFKNKGSDIYRIDSKGNLFERVKHKKEFFKNLEIPYDIIHIHTVLTTAYFFAKLAKKYTKAKVIVHSHTASNYEGAKLKNNLCRRLLNKYTDYRVACSKNAAEFLFGKKQAVRTDIIFNPVDVEAFQFDESIRVSKRKELGLLPEDFILLHVGRLTPAKNHKFLLQVFSEVHKSNSKTKLLLCGEGELRNNIENQVKELQLDNCVTLLGNRRDVNEIMSASDCFLFPSLYEGLPTVLIEAQVNGLPIICSDRITEEVIIDKRIDQLQLETINSWIYKLNDIIKKFDRNQLESNIINKINNRFGKFDIVNNLKQIYKEINIW